MGIVARFVLIYPRISRSDYFETKAFWQLRRNNLLFFQIIYFLVFEISGARRVIPKLFTGLRRLDWQTRQCVAKCSRNPDRYSKGGIGPYRDDSESRRWFRSWSRI